MKKKNKKVDISILLPTFNEFKNIEPIIKEITEVMNTVKASYEVLFIDDSSDETPRAIRTVRHRDSRIRMHHRKKENRNGLASALVEGFALARGKYICCLDSDLQHPPKNIKDMYDEMFLNGGSSMVVASRFFLGGKSDGLENRYRHVVSNMSKWVVWLLLSSTRKTTDPMTGYFMFEKKCIQGIVLNPTGFKILVELLVKVPAFKVRDVGMVMRKRFYNETKANFKQGIYFLQHVFRLKFDYVNIYSFVSNVLVYTFRRLYWVPVALVVLWILVKLFSLADSALVSGLIVLALFQIIQGTFATYLMIYAWEHPDRIDRDSSPKEFVKPRYSFTAIVPAINEADVIGDTIRAVASIEYPEELKQTLIVLRDTDSKTIAAARKEIKKIKKENISIQLISGEPFNKPHHLNAALPFSTGDIVCIFDAEDEPHKEIYDVVNTVMLRDNADVVQSGVQLMNYETNWYSIFNVLEYFLWFRSSLHFFASQKVIPLGGNTVFFKKNWLTLVGGWDWHGLTEDADIGIKLSNAGANIRIVYDPKHATQEETPPSLKSFVKQRTRWSQGFLQILFKGEWLKVSENTSLKSKFFVVYILGWPLINGIMFLTIPLSILVALFVKTHPIIGILTNVPLLVLIAFVIVQNVALYEFTRVYGKKWSIMYIPKVCLMFFPYQLLLGLSSFRAVVRQIRNQTSWEKTEHVNAHRIKLVVGGVLK